MARTRRGTNELGDENHPACCARAPRRRGRRGRARGCCRRVDEPAQGLCQDQRGDGSARLLRRVGGVGDASTRGASIDGAADFRSGIRYRPASAARPDTASRGPTNHRGTSARAGSYACPNASTRERAAAAAGIGTLAITAGGSAAGTRRYIWSLRRRTPNRTKRSGVDQRNGRGLRRERNRPANTHARRRRPVGARGARSAARDRRFGDDTARRVRILSIDDAQRPHASRAALALARRLRPRLPTTGAGRAIACAMPLLR